MTALRTSGERPRLSNVGEAGTAAVSDAVACATGVSDEKGSGVEDALVASSVPANAPAFVTLFIVRS